MPFPLHLMGKDPDRFLKLRTFAFRKFRTPGTEALIPFHFTDLKLRALTHQIFYNPFIFLRIKGTGGIEKHPSGPEHGRGLNHVTALKPGKKFRPVLLPGFDHLLFLPEHSFPGAGGIDQDLVKKLRKMRHQFSRLLAGHQHISDSQQFQIFQ